MRYENFSLLQLNHVAERFQNYRTFLLITFWIWWFPALLYWSIFKFTDVHLEVKFNQIFKSAIICALAQFTWAICAYAHTYNNLNRTACVQFVAFLAVGCQLSSNCSQSYTILKRSECVISPILASASLLPPPWPPPRSAPLEKTVSGNEKRGHCPCGYIHMCLWAS